MPPGEPPIAGAMGRLLTDLEHGAAEEERLAARNDWTALAWLLAKEFDLVQRLAVEQKTAGPALAPMIQDRIAALQTHYAEMQSRLGRTRQQVRNRLNELGLASRRAREVRRAYQAGAA
jgi:uncharacterized protein YicC (UPF0701 family)